MSESKKRPLCVGCRNFSIRPGRFRFFCQAWELASVRHDLAAIIQDSIGEPCPLFEPRPEKKVAPKERVNIIGEDGVDIMI
jgi:hypothetical protein